MLLRPAAHRLDRLAAVDLLGGFMQNGGIADRVPLREGDYVGLGRCRAGHEPLGLLQVGSLVGAAGQAGHRRV